MQFTKEQLTKRARRKVKELEFAITQSAFTSIRDGLEEELELARIALAALTAEPVAYNQVQRDIMKDIIVRKLGGNLLGDKLMMADIHAVTMALIQAGFRTAPPAPVADADPVVFTDERNLHHIARGRETSLIWGKQNQGVGDIPLYRHAQPVPVVPDERAAFNAWNNEDNLPIAGVGAKNAAWLAWQARASLCGNSALNVPPERPADSSNGDDVEAWFDEGWNACRTAMLNGGKS